jgi:hypothetical protein
MKIPEVREEMLRIAEEVEDLGFVDIADRLSVLEKELYRRPPVRRAQRRKKTPPHNEIRAYAAAHPDLDYQDIARHFGNCDSGRISEALAGFRQ